MSSLQFPETAVALILSGRDDLTRLSLSEAITREAGYRGVGEKHPQFNRIGA
jgi:hypothetical protein